MDRKNTILNVAIYSLVALIMLALLFVAYINFANKESEILSQNQADILKYQVIINIKLLK